MANTQRHNLVIRKYDGELNLINELAQIIEHNYSELFHSVIVHGSVATNEVIPYSDFDGLLIVKDAYVDSKQLQKFKRESMKIICKFDPLQHHGWFQLLESDLKNYPENYLPVTTLEHAKLIYPRIESLELLLKVNQNVDYRTALIKMLKQFEKREVENWRPNNIFQLKSVLSQVMLIPCLYYSAINGNGIFKRESFNEVKENFNEIEWKPIVISSQIRLNWNNNLNPMQKFLLKQSNPLLRKVIKKYLAPNIDSRTKLLLNDKFYENLSKLIKKIKTDIQ